MSYYCVPGARQNPNGPAMSILLVESTRSVRRFYSANLTARGFSTREASAIESAWSEITDAPPRLIIMGLILTRSSGMDLLARLTANPAAADIPVLVVTSQENLIDSLATFPDVRQVLVKPITVQQLVDAVEAILVR
jgi:DNA-binding response OmpR family regulator